jgi:PAS domain S-box-containing protein
MPSQPVPSEYAQSLPHAIADVNVPAYVLDDEGRVRWVNNAAQNILGDVVGADIVEVVDVDPNVARAIFGRRLAGREEGDHSVVIVSRDGSRHRVEVSSVRLRRGHRVVGMFGLAVSRDPKRSRHDASPLTHRQHEVLVLLADGASTEAIASRLFLSEQTVRNHVRHILQRLDCNSRLSAVAVARRNGYV